MTSDLRTIKGLPINLDTLSENCNYETFISLDGDTFAVGRILYFKLNHQSYSIIKTDNLKERNFLVTRGLNSGKFNIFETRQFKASSSGKFSHLVNKVTYFIAANTSGCLHKIEGDFVLNSDPHKKFFGEDGANLVKNAPEIMKGFMNNIALCSTDHQSRTGIATPGYYTIEDVLRSNPSAKQLYKSFLEQLIPFVGRTGM